MTVSIGLLVVVAMAPQSAAADEWLRPEPHTFEYSFPEPRQLDAAETEAELEPYLREHMCGVCAQVFWNALGKYDIHYGGHLRLHGATLLGHARGEGESSGRLSELSPEWKSLIAWNFIGIQGGTEHIEELQGALEAAVKIPLADRKMMEIKRVIQLASSLASLQRRAGNVAAILELLSSKDAAVRRVTMLEVADWPEKRLQDRLAELAPDAKGSGFRAIERFQESMASFRRAASDRERLEILFRATRRGSVLTGSPGGRWALRRIVILANEQPELVGEVCREKLEGKAWSVERELCDWALRHLENPIDGRKPKGDRPR